MSSSQRKRSGKQKPKTPALDELRSSHEIAPRHSRRTFYDGYDVLPSSLTYNIFDPHASPVVEAGPTGPAGPAGSTSSRVDAVARLLASRAGPSAVGPSAVGPSAVGPSAVGPTPRFRNVPDVPDVPDDDIDTIVDNLSGMTTRREWGGDDDDGPAGSRTRKNKKRSRRNKKRLYKTKSRKHH